MRGFLFSLRTRVILIVVFGFTIFVVAVVYQAVRERDARLAIAQNNLANSANLIATAALKDIKFAELHFAHLVPSSELSGLVSAKECEHRFAQALEQLPAFSNVLYALPDGTVICSGGQLKQPLNIADSPDFKAAMTSSDSVIGETFDGRASGKRVLPIYKAVRDEHGEVQGVLNIAIELAWINRTLENSKNSEGTRVGLIDPQGKILARYPDPEHWVGRSAFDSMLFKAIVAHGGVGVFKGIGLDNVPRIFGFTHFFPTRAGPITLWVAYTVDDVTAVADSYFRNVLTGALVLLLITFGAIWFGVERLILRPVSVLSGVARRLGAGDLSARTGIGSGRDELAVLARTVDDMAELLASKSLDVILADRALKVLSAWNSVLLRPGDERGLADGMCKAIVDAGGYQMAWVGFALDTNEKTVRPVASAGTPEGFLEDLRVTWAETEEGRNPAGKAIRQGNPTVVNDVQTNPDAEAWREHARRFGYSAIMAIPLKSNDVLIGVLVIGATQTKAFAEQEAALLAEVATHLASVIVDLRSRAERARHSVALRTGEEKFRAAAEASPDALFVFKSVRDSAGNIVDFEITEMNARAAQQIGVTREEAIGKTYLGLLPLYKTVSLFDDYKQVATTGTKIEGEFAFDVPRKGIRWFRQQVVRVGDGLAIALRDVTTWKKAGGELRQSEERLRRAMQAADMDAWQWDLATDQISSSAGMGRFFGMASASGPRTLKEMLDAVYPADREKLARAMASDRAVGTHSQREYRVLWPDGSIHWLIANTNVLGDASGNPTQVVGLLAEITRRKEAEIARDRANRALRTLSAGNEELVRATSESDLLHAVCRVIVETGGYRSASVGYPQDDQEKTIAPMAWAGADQRFMTEVMHTWADREEGQRPIARAIRTKMPVIASNIADEFTNADFKNPGAEISHVSILALPLLDGTQLIGALNICADEEGAFDQAEIRLLEELAADLAYGIRTYRTRAERDNMLVQHQHHEEILRRGLEESVQAIAATVEMRDPYTSGHQKRVADLAVAIATAMGLDTELIHGIHLAGVVHDLGKITIPSEILSKPGKLSAIELQLIQGHPQAGYDLLKEIHFPWPIARIVWEHHERLDGTGYPRGIKGDEMLLESRIMSVADVAEAMASHRPYRASLGIETALQELERGRGTGYDPAVVDACLKLFREDGFILQT